MASSSPPTTPVLETAPGGGGVFFEIDTGLLRKEAKRPRHVARRFGADGTALTAASSSGSESEDNGGAGAERDLARAATKRERLLAQRRAKLAKHNHHVRSAARAAQHARYVASMTYLNSMEQTLASAERKRSRLVADKQRQCATAVLKAKEVARKTAKANRESKERMRAGLENKLRASSWRRQQIAKISRTQLVSSESVEQVMRERAALGIQAWWRHAKVQPALEDFARMAQQTRSSSDKAKTTIVTNELLGKLNVAYLKSVSFMQAAAILQNPVVIKVTSRLLQRLKTTAVEPPHLGKTPTRVFLSMYMLLAHTGVLVEDQNGPLEKELTGTAQTLQDALNTLLSLSLPSNRDSLHAAMTSFLQAWFSFHTTFNAFKSKDTQGVIDNLIAHTLETVRLLANVSGNSETTDLEWRPSLLKQVKLMRQRLQRVGGVSAIEQLERALQAENLHDVSLDEQFVVTASRSGTPTVETTPSDSVLASPAAKRTTLSRSASVTLDSAPTQVVNAASAGTSSQEAAMESMPERLRAISGNHALAHEVIMDPEFELRPERPTGLAAQVRDAAQRAYATRIDEMVAANDFAFVPAMLREIRTSLLGMVQDDSNSAQMIQGAIDVDMVEQELRQSGKVDVRACLGHVVSVMRRLAAPVRDAEINALASETSVSAAIMAIHQALENMHLDMANFHLRKLRPMLQEKAVEYETSKFVEYLAGLPQSGAAEGDVTGLEYTTKWLQGAAAEQLSTTQARNPEGVPLNEATRPKFEEVYHEALLALITSNTAVNPATCPETLRMDVKRLFDMQNEIQALTIVSSLVMVVRNAFPWFRNAEVANPKYQALKRTGPASESRESAMISSGAALGAQLLLLLNDAQTTTKDHLVAAVTSSVERCMPGEGKLDEKQKELVQAMVTKTLSAKDPVFSIVARRVATTIRQHMAQAAATGAQEQQATPARVRRDSLLANGLDAVEEPLTRLAGRVAALAKHNKAVYARWYDAILAKALAL